MSCLGVRPRCCVWTTCCRIGRRLRKNVRPHPNPLPQKRENACQCSNLEKALGLWTRSLRFSRNLEKTASSPLPQFHMLFPETSSAAPKEEREKNRPMLLPLLGERDGVRANVFSNQPLNQRCIIWRMSSIRRGLQESPRA